MDRQSKQSEVTDQMLKDYFDKGGTITKCPQGARTDDIEYKGGFYGKKKKKDKE